MGISVFPQPSSGGETKYSVFSEYNTDADSSSTTVNVSIPIGVYQLEQISQPQTNSSTVAGQPTVGTQNRVIKFTSGVTSVAFNLRVNPDLNLSANNWVTRTSDTTEGLIGAAFGNNTYLAIGTNVFVTSTDSITWTTRTPPNPGNGAQVVTFGAGVFVVQQGGGNLYSSTNAITWTQRTSTFGTSQVNGLTFGNNLFVAVGANGKLATSTNGITWTSRDALFGTTQINTVGFGDGRYIAGGNYDGSRAMVRISTDAITWATVITTFTSVMNNIVYGNGVWVANGNNTNDVATSNDGISWTSRGAAIGAGAISSLFYGNGFFIATGGSDAGFVRVSTNGVTWQNQNANWPSNTRTAAITYNNGVYVLTGFGGNIRTSTLVRDKSNTGLIFTKLNAAE
jgi:hypothetical protein